MNSPDNKTTNRSIWELKNTAGIIKAGIETVFANASLAMAIAAIAIYAGITIPAFLGFTAFLGFAAFFANPIGITFLFIMSVYFAAQAISSYQQMEANLKIENADFTVLVGDTLMKKGQVVAEETEEKLMLKLSAADYTALVGAHIGDITLSILLPDKIKIVEVKFTHVDSANDNGNYKVQLTHVNGKSAFGEMKTALGTENLENDLKVFEYKQAAESIVNNVILQSLAVKTQK